MLAPILRVSLSSLLAHAAVAQWSNNPAQNFAVGDRPGDQAVTKAAAIPGGGCYLGWFDNAGSGYEVRLQRLDVNGVEQWAHNGIVVSANPQNSSLQDWDLICDSAGNCVLAFTDTRTGPDLDVFAYRIDPTGTQLWGANGVALSVNADADSNPRLCETGIGDFAFVWVNNTNATVRLQRLDQFGTPFYAPDGIGQPGDVGGNPAFARVVPSDNGGVIATWVRAFAFSATKHIHAQKFDILGAPQWNGGTRLAVFDSNSLPIAHDPKLVSDGIGGAVLAWHFSSGTQFSSRVQHLSAAGVELFPHNGVDVSTNGNSRLDPSLTFDVATQSATVVWKETNLGQTTWGIVAQKFDAAGAPLWPANGVTLRAIDTVEKIVPVSVPYQGGAMAFWLETVAPLNRQLRGMRIDAAGALQWAPTAVSTAAGDKLRVAACVSTSGMAMLGWSDGRTAGNGNDIYAQNIGATGVLAPAVGGIVPYGCGGNPAGSMTVSGRAALGATVVTGIDNPLGTQAIGSIAVLALSPAALPTFPCGVPVAGFGMAGAGANGEILIDPTSIELFFGPAWAGPGQPALIPLTIPHTLSFVGMPAFFQGALLDPSPFAAVPIGVTTAARWDVGF